VSDIEKWGDSQQYRAEPHGSYAGPESGVMPQVTLISMTPHPLGVIGAMAAMYEGRVVRDVSHLTHEDCVRYWHDVRSTHLDTPLEAVQFQFLIEGVDRSFTHQLVRKRVGAAYAQESLRFAVPGRLSESTSLPPSLQGTKPFADWVGSRDWVEVDLEGERPQKWRREWDDALSSIDRAYHALVASGMPAEEARGILPHCTATRVVWVTNLRSLLQEAGNRLCTQAQFHWKMVMGQVVREIRRYPERLQETWAADYEAATNDETIESLNKIAQEQRDQFTLIAEAFKPVCYEKGRCPFGATFDRVCTIKDRVRRFAAKGIPSDQWGVPDERFPRHHIRTEEWLLNPGAARKVD